MQMTEALGGDVGAPVLSEIPSGLGIRIVRQNHRMIRTDASSPALARNAHNRLDQVDGAQSVLIIRFCNNGDEVRRGRAQI